jgi:hypothetical protein
MAATVSHGVAGAGRFLHREFVALWLVFLFFLVSFALLITLIKLVLEDYSTEVLVVSNAFVGALLAAKAVLVLDETPLARSRERYRKIFAIAVKTLFYGIATLILGFLERCLEALRKAHGFGGAFDYVINHGSYHRLPAWALGISMIFALYFSFVEISRRMGEGELWKLLFESPE